MKAKTLLQYVGIAALVVAALALARYYPEAVRYFKMRSM